MVVIPGKEDRPTNLSIVLPGSDYTRLLTIAHRIKGTPGLAILVESDTFFIPFPLSSMDNNCPTGTTLNNPFNHVDSSNYERLLIQLISIHYYQQRGNATVSYGIKLLETGYSKNLNGKYSKILLLIIFQEMCFKASA